MQLPKLTLLFIIFVFISACRDEAENPQLLDPASPQKVKGLVEGDFNQFVLKNEHASITISNSSFEFNEPYITGESYILTVDSRTKQQFGFLSLLIRNHVKPS
ncbi:MAG: hypothetical protein OEY38_16245 [Gammaproteobacteria bacterium]|nr:hypothetical protein [Gammaproteobacteria bacterium]